MDEEPTPGTMKPRLCVIIATRNRCDDVLRALDSVLPQLTPADDVVVASDGSTDQTVHAVRTRLTESRSQGRLLDLPRSGASSTRNAAARETTADILCFLDDDAVAESSWLDGLRRLWSSAGPRVGVIGGRIIPVWESGRPPWFAEYLDYVVSARDLGPRSLLLDLNPGRYVWGANMSVRFSAFRSVGGFDVRHGSRPEAPWARGEEEELQRRLASAGWETWYEPRLLVFHRIPAERASPASFRALFRNSGLQELYEGTPRMSAIAILLRAIARYAWLRARRRPEAETATFTLARGWTILTSRRPRNSS